MLIVLPRPRSLLLSPSLSLSLSLSRLFEYIKLNCLNWHIKQASMPMTSSPNHFVQAWQFNFLPDYSSSTHTHTHTQSTGAHVIWALHLKSNTYIHSSLSFNLLSLSLSLSLSLALSTFLLSFIPLKQTALLILPTFCARTHALSSIFSYHLRFYFIFHAFCALLSF